MSLRAVFDSPCALCGHLIRTGEVKRPLSKVALGIHASLPQESTGSAPKLTKKGISHGVPKDDGIAWSHLACAPSNEDMRIPICKHWKYRGSCVFQSSCLFRHPETESDEETGCKETLRRRRGCRLRRRIFNEGRAAALRRWALNVFGDAYLRSGSGILDVAGGKGELSFEFENLNSIPTCVFDPRALKLSRFCRKLEFGFYHRNEVLGRFNPQPKPAHRSEMRAPRQIRAFFEMNVSMKKDARDLEVFRVDDKSDSESDVNTEADADLVSTSDEAHVTGKNSMFYYPDMLQSDETFASGLHTGQQTRWTTQGLEEGLEDVLEVNAASETVSGSGSAPLVDELADSIQSNFLMEQPSLYCASNDQAVVSSTDHATDSFPDPRQVTSYDDARKIVRDCSLVVGMHPDQAVDHILDFAVLNNKPCAFIPCCVYANQFPRRRTATTGRTVRKYGELIEYLLAKLSVCVLCASTPPSVDQNLNRQAAAPLSSSNPGWTEGTGMIQSLESPPNLAQFGVVEMDFEGKNLLIFYTAGRPLLSDPYAAQTHISRGPARAEQWWALSDNNSAMTKA